MQLENQVTSLELSKKLKGLGVPQESLFGWQKVGDDYQLENFESKGYRDFSAYTVAELGELLPKSTEKPRHYVDYSWSEKSHALAWFWSDENKKESSYHEEANTEANARAKMLVYLLENNLIRV